MRPAAFLDRDGTLIREVNYLHRPEQIEIIPGIPEKLRELRARGYALVLVTNQAGVGRGYFGLDDVQAVHEALQDRLGLRFDAIHVCPHHPDAGCACRKPRDAMLRRAIAELHLDAARSFIVGDKVSDVLAGYALGIPGWLVATGHAEVHPDFPRLASLAEWR